MISNDLIKMIKRANSVQEGVAPINTWMVKVYEPAMKTMRMTQGLTSVAEVAISKAFKAAAHIEAVELYRDIVRNKTAKGIAMFNSPLWNLTDSILTNHHAISAAIEKTAAIVNMYEKTASINKTVTGLESFFEKAFPHDYSKKLITLNAALKGLSAQIIFSGHDQSDVEILEQFSATTDGAVVLTAELAEKNYATKEDIKKLEEFIEKTINSPIAKIVLWMNILGFVLTIWQMAQPFLITNVSNENAATKEDIQKLVESTENRFQESLSIAGFKAETRIRSHLRYRPSSKSQCMFCIKPGEVVHIIESNHKWVRVTVIDPSDNFPITGWILRKYLIRN